MELKKYKKRRITPQGWKEITLADAFNTSSGATPLSTEASYYENGTIPWINSGELASPYIYDTTNFISQAGFENSSTEIYPIDTVLVAMYGATAGKASLLKMEACTNQAICAILPNKDYSSTFLKYSIDTLYDHLVGLSSGSARDNLSQAALKKLKLIMPPTKDEQNKLVSILALIDRKIELNRAINQNLEAMAKQLYDYWFVQFDFPNEEGKPYKSNGGEMVWNEVLKREIPKDWEVLSFGDLFNIGNGKNIPNSSGTIPVYGGNGIIKYVDKSNYDSCFIVGRVGANCGSLHYSPTKCWVSDNAISVVPKNLNEIAYLLFSLKLYDLSKNKGGSSQPLVTHKGLECLAFPYSVKFVSKFCNIANKLLNLYFENINSLLSLTKQRNELLPLLMNGQVSVNSDLSAY